MGLPRGFKHSLETRRKISEAGKGRILSEKTREKISKAHIGKRLSEATKKKIKRSSEPIYKLWRITRRGEGNPAWKGGSFSFYTRFLKSACEVCRGTKNLLVHHKDRNRKNNKEENLATLCKSCHGKEHKHENPTLFKKGAKPWNRDRLNSFNAAVCIYCKKTRREIFRDKIKCLKKRLPKRHCYKSISSSSP